MTTLEDLNIGSLGLERIPDEIANMPNLRNLYANSNPLQSLPDWLWDLDILELLDLQSVGLSRVSYRLADLPNLKELKIARNSLTSLTVGSSLEVLDISKNNFTSLPDLSSASARIYEN